MYAQLVYVYITNEKYRLLMSLVLISIQLINLDTPIDDHSEDGQISDARIFLIS